MHFRLKTILFFPYHISSTGVVNSLTSIVAYHENAMFLENCSCELLKARVFVRAGTQGPLVAYCMLRPGYFLAAYKRMRANPPHGPC